MKSETSQENCAICGRTLHPGEAISGRLLQPALRRQIQARHADFSEESRICLTDLARFRAEHVAQERERERAELAQLDAAVAESLRQGEIQSRNINQEFERKLSLGEKIADRVAEFGGSWTFIITFGVILTLWMIANILLLRQPFDPYPFILLNLVLSTLAAIQAPVIIMSQNRQEEKDRLRGENDYRVNLKAEMEVRHLHAKMDHLLVHQWQRLLEIQQMQVEMLEEMQQRLPPIADETNEADPTETAAGGVAA